MKTKLTYVLVLAISFSLTGFSQVLNGSFENGVGADLSNWKWTCSAQSFSSAPVGGGNWCIKIDGGATQGCFPSYAYQKIPSIADGETYILSGWIFSKSYSLGYSTSPMGINFGKIKNGIITIQAGDTTSSLTWKKLSIQSTYTLSPGDTALVILNTKTLGGPFNDFGYFDSISLQNVTGIFSFEKKQNFKIFPSPNEGQFKLQIDYEVNDGELILLSSIGQKVHEQKISQGENQVNTNGLSKGLYNYVLLQNKQRVSSGKLVIE